MLNHIEQSIMDIENIFITEPPTLLYKCKPHLAHFLTGLVGNHIWLAFSRDLLAWSFLESGDSDAKSCVAWKLFQLILTERHWAFTYLVIVALGHFAANTTCTQLCIFLPQNETLSYEIVSGLEVTNVRFIVELKAFYDKQIALIISILY